MPIVKQQLALKGVRLRISANYIDIMCQCFFLGWQVCAVVVLCKLFGARCQCFYLLFVTSTVKQLCALRDKKRGVGTAVG